MAAAKKIPDSKPKATSKQPAQSRIRGWFLAASERRRGYLARRPHRSFKRTMRRDYKRSLRLPGYIAMTKQIFSILAKNKRVFIGLALLYGLLAILLSSMMSQDTYLQLRETIDEAASEDGIGALVSNIAIFWGVFTSQLSGDIGGEIGTSQQIFSVLFGLYLWLAVVWMLRAITAGKRPKIRDGLYSSGGPVLGLLLLVFVLLLQLLPAAAAVITYGAADASGLLDQTAILMLFGGGAFMLVTLSLYWMTSTFMAMIIVTLPGMYPMQALKVAGDLVIGRRVRILLRLMWSIFLLLLVWAVVLLPVIALDGVLKSAVPALEWLPLVPLVALLLMSFSLVFEASYVYLFYRKVVDDDASPA